MSAAPTCPKCGQQLIATHVSVRQTAGNNSPRFWCTNPECERFGVNENLSGEEVYDTDWTRQYCVERHMLVDRLSQLANLLSKVSVSLFKSPKDFPEALATCDSIKTEWDSVLSELQKHIQEHQCVGR